MGTDAADSILDLVRRIAARPPPPRVVSPQEFLAIACNRCGACCEEIFAPDGPEGIAAEADNPTLGEDGRRFLAGLIPVRPVSGGWLYRCRHFSRDPAAAGICAIYEDRPATCRSFPGGRPVLTWSQCSWYVEIRDTSADEIATLNRGLGSIAGPRENGSEQKEVRDGRPGDTTDDDRGRSGGVRPEAGCLEPGTDAE